jgi:hypothetical protein
VFATEIKGELEDVVELLDVFSCKLIVFLYMSLHACQYLKLLPAFSSAVVDINYLYTVIKRQTISVRLRMKRRPCQFSIRRYLEMLEIAPLLTIFSFDCAFDYVVWA